MKGLVERIGLKALSCLDPETAHTLAVRALATGIAPPVPASVRPELGLSIGPLAFPNPVGIAAGFDKNGEAAQGILKLGFGFTEIGTVTPRPQPGNPKPRVFRLTGQEAVINRYGFNSDGHDAVLRRLPATGFDGIVGINVGANKDSEDRISDYVAGIRSFAKQASFFTVNISSPNTPGLRDLQARANLESLAVAVLEARSAAEEEAGRTIPVFIKIAPDVSEEDLDDICDVSRESGIDGLIVSNTTLSRHGVEDSPHAGEAGGLSGAPLFERSTIVLAKVRQRVGPGLPLIGVGGIHNAETAWQKVLAGASLVQVYTALVYRGPSLLAEILDGLADRLAASEFDRLTDAVGTQSAAWAEKPLET